MLRFNDGVSIDTSGELRSLHLKDGWYVVGKGMCIPVDDRAAALEEIKAITDTGQFVVERNCCTSGQCFQCLHLPRGQYVRVVQTTAKTRAEAERIARNWSEYAATIRKPQHKE